MRNILLAILLIYINSIRSQEKPGPFVKRILSHPSSVLIFNLQSASNEMPIHKITDLPVNFKFSGQSITKTSNGLYLNHLGTGRIYKWIGNEKIGKWEREDSTYFSGYNFLSLFFSVDSNIYSFGGIGFWHINGNLRKYNFTAKEWNVIRLNKSIPWIFDNSQLFYIDTLNNKLYFNGQGRFFDAGLADLQIDSSTINKIYCIDIEKRTFEELGNYEPAMNGFIGQTPWGSIISFDKVADYTNNRFYKFSNKIESQLLKIMANSNKEDFIKQYSFWIDSVLYITKYNQQYDSIIIHKSDLIPINKRIYFSNDKKTSSNQSSIPWAWVIFTSVFISLTIYLYKRKKIKIDFYKNNNGGKNELYTNEKYKLNLVELSLLQLIFENSVIKKTTDIPAINTILGCSNKSIEVQKRLRSDTINMINQKICMSLLIDYNIIQRKRSDFDGRSFEYYIDEIHLQQVSKLLT